MPGAIAHCTNPIASATLAAKPTSKANCRTAGCREKPPKRSINV
jgi:hypothetical protein